MITAVNGKVAKVGLDWVDVDLGAITVRVNVPSSTGDHVGGPGEPVRLFTSLQVREDSLTLYGFASEDSRRSFESLIGINGVGPKLGLSILSLFTPEDLAASVAAEDVTAFTRVSGVGKKTAGRIVLELKGRLGTEWEVSVDGVKTGDVLQALTALGYSLAEAREAVASLPPGSGTDTEERVRAALDRLAGG